MAESQEGYAHAVAKHRTVCPGHRPGRVLRYNLRGINADPGGQRASGSDGGSRTVEHLYRVERRRKGEVLAVFARYWVERERGGGQPVHGVGKSFLRLQMHGVASG